MRDLETRYGPMKVPGGEGDIICRFLDRYGEWAWLEACFVASVLEDDSRVLDVGAFVGTFGLGVALERSIEYLAFVEANGQVIDCLRNNVSHNLNCSFEIIEGMVSGAVDELRIGHSAIDNLGSASFSEVGLGPVEIPASKQILSLKEIRLREGKFDLIKLDIEGMELEALRGDTEYLATGETTLWIECNETRCSLDIAALLLSWNLDVFYFAFPSFNVDNYNRYPHALFPMAFEAGLLVAPKVLPRLTSDLEASGCILKFIRSTDDLKEALWLTPRWGRPEWEHTKTRAELAAAVCRSLRDEEFSSFLDSSQPLDSSKRETIWQRLAAAEVGLTEARALVTEEREKRLAVDRALNKAESLALERHGELKRERDLRESIETAYREVEALAIGRLSHLEAEREKREATEIALAEAEALVVERLSDLMAERKKREATEIALAEAETLVMERLSLLTVEREKREATEIALAEVEALAVKRMIELAAAREKLAATETALQGVEALALERLTEIGVAHRQYLVLEERTKELVRSSIVAVARADAAELELAAASARSLAHLARLGSLRDELDGPGSEVRMQIVALKRSLANERSKAAALQMSLYEEQERSRKARQLADDIRFSTVWRISAPLRAVVQGIPVLHSALRRGRSFARTIVRGRQR